ncbi:hypothetical protein [Actinokineospora iranica]|uniref:Uncharacterized protein n=1 Tax=Actinokineospora iranica TaxID=1271860 RepID=A0A1G6TP21_9PSEU|nr:hypothetical protein [Actinokineospora iranica]SDD30624.1 hypothetical protein SAMN05216174_109235 [Actinokineospora iranica]
MRTVRILLGLAGLAALAFGATLAADFGMASWRDTGQALAFFVGGPLAHDAVVAPLVGAIGLVIARRLPPAWRAPVAAGAVASGVLILLAVPLLWRPFGVPTNPGLHDRNYWLGLGIALAVVWLIAVTAAVLSQRRPS